MALRDRDKLCSEIQSSKPKRSTQGVGRVGYTALSNFVATFFVPVLDVDLNYFQNNAGRICTR